MTSIAAGEAGPAAGLEPVTPRARERRGGPPAGRREVHRLRDLGRRDRRWAVAVAAALLLAPAAAFAMFAPEWAPTNDPALMGLRALDVGTPRTPFVGQPSQSGLYAEAASPVHHPGPLHLYLMAVPVRLLGAAVAMPLVSVAITGSCLAVSAWAVFRQLGREAGVVAAAALALVAFTTGASSLVNPVSSSIAGYPLLCSAVVLWCVGAGDVRLLPLAAAVVSFTAQQHLSVVPATLVLAAGGLAMLAVGWRRAGRGRHAAHRRELARWGPASGAVALVLWAPVLAQQVLGDEGNVGRMLWFARHGNRDTLGYGSAVRQVAHATGLPPLLGRTDLTGDRLLAAPSWLTWASAAAALAAVAALSWRWRATDRRQASLGPMVGVVLAAGLVNGSSVPRGFEQTRLAFYHWAFALAFFVAVVLGLAVVGALRPRAAGWRPGVRAALAAVAVAVVAAPSVVNTRLDRRTNTQQAAYASVEHAALAELADGIEAHADGLGDHTLLISRHEPPLAGIAPGLALELAQRGIAVQHPLYDRFFVHDQRLVDPGRLDGGLVLVVDRELPSEAPSGGELVAEVDLAPGIDVDDYRALLAAARAADEVRLGPAAERAVAELPDEGSRAFMRGMLDGIVDDPERALLQPALVEFMLDHPLAQPALDPARVERLADALDRLDAGGTAARLTRLRVYRLDRDETLDLAVSSEVGQPGD